MGTRKRFIDRDISPAREHASEFRIICLFPGPEAEIFKQYNIRIAIPSVAERIRDKRHGPLQRAREKTRDGCERERRLPSAAGPAHVRQETQPCFFLEQQPYGGQHPFNPPGIGNPAVPNPRIKIRPKQNARTRRNADIVQRWEMHTYGE